MRLRPTVLALVLLGLAACQSVASLDYVPTVPIVAGPPASISAVTATDMRGDDPKHLATVRGGFGNPMYSRGTTQSVADEVASVFTKGLQARGMLSTQANAPYRMQLVVRTFDANKYIHRNAAIDLDLAVIDRAGRTVYKDSVKDERETFQFFDADIDGLQKLAQDVLNAAVDRMLDNPKLRTVLSSRPAPSAPST